MNELGKMLITQKQTQKFDPEKIEIIKLHNVNDTINIKPVEIIAENLLVPGFVQILAHPKTGKTYFMLQLLIAVAQGKKAFGKFNTIKSKVLYISFEETTQEIIEKIQLFENVDKLDNMKILGSEKHFPRWDEGGQFMLEKYLEEDKDIKIFGFDTFQDVRPNQKSEGKNAYQSTNLINSQIAGWGKDRGKSIFLSHHLCKGASEFSNIGERANGSMAEVAKCDNAVFIERDPFHSYMTMQNVSRTMGIKSEQYILSMNPNNAQIKYVGLIAKEENRYIGANIVNHIRSDFPGGITIEQVLSHIQDLGLKKSRYNALSIMAYQIRDGVIKMDKGKEGKKEWKYVIADEVRANHILEWLEDYFPKKEYSEEELEEEQQDKKKLFKEIKEAKIAENEAITEPLKDPNDAF